MKCNEVYSYHLQLLSLFHFDELSSASSEYNGIYEENDDNDFDDYNDNDVENNGNDNAILCHFTQRIESMLLFGLYAHSHKL